MSFLYTITSRFMEKETFRSHGHLGLDFAMPEGTPLRSIHDGTIVQITHLQNNIGNGVLIKWTDGKTAIYGHLSRVADNLTVGDRVKVGDLIGYSGHSGSVVGNPGDHLHFGLKEGGRFIDPSPYADQIQNMNNVAGNHLEHAVQTGYTFADLFKGQMQAYSDIFHSLKLNIIHGLSLIDYTVFIQHLQHIFQLFLG